MPPEQPLCQWQMAHEGRICDAPAVGIYHGIGGSQPVCDRHARSLQREWGIKVKPINTEEERSDEELRDEEIDARLREGLRAEMLEAQDTRRSIIQIASRIVEALSGENEKVQRYSDRTREFARAPEAIPDVNWQDRRWGGEEEDPWHMSTIGNLGDYYASVFNDNPPSLSFNIGFYAAVLAVKEGLISPDDFKREEKLTWSTDELLAEFAPDDEQGEGERGK